ncbi:MAG: lamin tail domain-containing protein [Candidatus Adlerbacteria bacterium]|nr:lamin tail domain-containing protein [Candidatus Adlerbacteria bacterium]
MIPRTNKPLVACLLLGASMVSVAQGSAGTGSFFSDIEASVGNVFQAGTWTDPQSPFNIVLNEFLPNPVGNDNGSGLDGEWVELYNNGDVDLDVAGWYIADGSGGIGNQQAVISGTNTHTGGTVVPAHGWLVIFMNHQTFDNPNGDSVYLYTDSDVLVDSYSFPDHDFCENEDTPGSSNNTSTPGPGDCDDPGDPAVPEGKSYARIPDGTGAWVDPIPTPGGPNELEEDAVSPEPASTEPLEVEVSDEPLQVTEEEPVEVEVSDEPLEILPPPSSSSEEGGEEVPTPALEGEGEPAQSEPEPTPEPETTPEPEVVEEPAEEPEPEPETEPEADEVPPSDQPSGSDQP